MSCNKNKVNATPQELHAALKLIELLYIKGEIPPHVYRNICAEYHDTVLDSQPPVRYHIDNTRKDAV